MSSTAAQFTTPTSATKLFVASALWAAAIVPAAWLSSQFLSIPGAFGASFFWLPQIFMVTAAIWLGPWGWVAAAVGTFLGGWLAGNPLAINIAQNPIPAFFGNALLAWVLFKVFRVKISGPASTATGNQVLIGILAVIGTVVVAVVAGFLVGPALGNWGYLVVFLLTLVGWYALNRMGFRNVGINRDVVMAVLAVVISSLVSAIMGGIAWATVGGMGSSAYTIVTPGWFLGDAVAGSLGVAVLWAFDAEMHRRGLVWGA